MSKDKKKKPFVSIIIPSYNTCDLLKKNLPKVLKTLENKDNRILEVILVDDASPDESVKVVKEKFPQIRLIKHKINRGFSASVNTGARSANGKLLALLNTDVVPEKDFLVSSLPHFKDRNVFAVSFKEGKFSWAKGMFKDGFINHRPGRVSEETHETFWVNGGSGMFRRSHWMKLGGMDEKLLNPFYWEDVDLCYRAAKRGLILLWEPKSKVTHEHGATISKLSKKYVARVRERNQLLFIWKNLTSPIMFRKHFRGLLLRLSRHPGYVRIVLMALMRIKLVLRARKKEKKECKVSDEVIFSRYK